LPKVATRQSNGQEATCCQRSCGSIERDDC
jgi:hypothetical protein